MRIGRLKEKLIELTPRSKAARDCVIDFWDRHGSDGDEVTHTLVMNFVFGMQTMSQMARPSISAIALGVVPEDDQALVESNELDACVRWVSDNWNSPLEQMEEACDSES